MKTNWYLMLDEQQQPTHIHWHRLLCWWDTLARRFGHSRRHNGLVSVWWFLDSHRNHSVRWALLLDLSHHFLLPIWCYRRFVPFWCGGLSLLPSTVFAVCFVFLPLSAPRRKLDWHYRLLAANASNRFSTNYFRRFCVCSPNGSDRLVIKWQ